MHGEANEIVRHGFGKVEHLFFSRQACWILRASQHLVQRAAARSCCTKPRRATEFKAQESFRDAMTDAGKGVCSQTRSVHLMT